MDYLGSWNTSLTVYEDLLWHGNRSVLHLPSVREEPEQPQGSDANASKDLQGDGTWTHVFQKSHDAELLHLQALAKLLSIYYVPSITAFGVFTNILICVVISNSQLLDKLSLTPYLTSLACCDTAYLVASLFLWLRSAHHIDLLCYPGICQIVWFVWFVTNFMSVWFVVGLQAQCYITMWHPARCKEFCTKKRSRCICSTLGVTALLGYSVVLWTSGLVKTSETASSRTQVCAFLQRFMGIIQVFTKTDCFLTAVMPYIMLPIVNLMILTQIIVKSISIRTNTRRGSSSSTSSSRSNGYIRRVQAQINITTSMLFVSCTLWGMNIMSQSPRIRDFFQGNGPKAASNPREAVLEQFYQHSHLTSFAVKLLLYLLFSGLFRRGIFECCRTYTCPCAQCKDEEEEEEEEVGVPYDISDESITPPPSPYETVSTV